MIRVRVCVCMDDIQEMTCNTLMSCWGLLISYNAARHANFCVQMVDMIDLKGNNLLRLLTIEVFCEMCHTYCVLVGNKNQ